MKIVSIRKSDKILKGEVCLPSSKSISNRLLIIGALSGVGLSISNLSEADDTILLKLLLQKIRKTKPGEYIELDAQNAGTAVRFLTAFLSVSPGVWKLTGSTRMKKRPIKILVDAIRCLGADIQYIEKEGFLPLLIKGKELKGGKLTLETGVSSQFVSALMMIAPFLRSGLRIGFKGAMVSKPYIEMTAQLLEGFGISVKMDTVSCQIDHQKIVPCDLAVEPDWTSASYWYEAAALADDVDLFIQDLQKESIQGDAALPEIYNKLGISTSFDQEGIRISKKAISQRNFKMDLANHPDLIPAIVATFAGLNIQGRFHGTEHLKYKESDRISAIGNELKRIGAGPFNYIESEKMVTIKSGKKCLVYGSPVQTYKDHRIAMSFAPLALKTGFIQIEEPDVVNKSYPDFWDQMKNAGFSIDFQ